MPKKLQVFVSSTYTDLRLERQAAVEAILKAGHIPAGMELFTAGSESQLTVIKDWIDESDVFMLILGGRYGSIEPKSGKSYTHVEYEYARAKEKPLFTVIASETALTKKAINNPNDVETTNTKLNEFRELVLSSHICEHFDDPKDIKIATHAALTKHQQDSNIPGWVSGREAQQPKEFRQQIAELTKEIKALREANEALRRAPSQAKDRADPEIAMGKKFSELLHALKQNKITIPASVTGKESRSNLAGLFIYNAGTFATGVRNAANANETEGFLFTVAQKLIPFGLIQHGKVPNGVYWDKLVTTEAGNRFLVEAQFRQNKEENDNTSAASVPKKGKNGGTSKSTS